MLSPIGSSSSSSASHSHVPAAAQAAASQETRPPRPSHEIRAEITKIGAELVNAFQQHGAANQPRSHRVPGQEELPDFYLHISRDGMTATVSFSAQRSGLKTAWKMAGDFAAIKTIGDKASRFGKLQQELRAAERSEYGDHKRKRELSPAKVNKRPVNKRPDWASFADPSAGRLNKIPDTSGNIDGGLSSTVQEALKVLNISLHGEVGFGNVMSVLHMGNKKKLDALQLLIDEGELGLEPESDQENSALSDLVEYLAEPRRLDFSKFRDGQKVEGQEVEDEPTDEQRVAVLKDIIPRGRCSNGQPVLEFAVSKGMTYVVETFLNSTNFKVQKFLATSAGPELKKFLATSASPELKKQFRLANISSSIPDAVLSFEEDVIQNDYQKRSDKEPFSLSRDFREGVHNLGSSRYVKNIGKAIKHFEIAASGKNHESAHKLRIQLESYRNLILIQKKNELKLVEPIQQQEALMKSIREAHCFVSSLQTLPLPDDQPSRSVIAQIYGEIMEQWEHFSSEEKKNVFLPEILYHMENNDIFLDATEVAFHRAIFDPLVVHATDADLQSRLVQALKKAEALNADYSPSGGEDCFTLTAAHSFMEKIGVEEWKNTQDEGSLTQILSNIRTRRFSGRQETLEYFDLFVHAKTPAAKDEIAMEFGKRAKETEFQLKLHTKAKAHTNARTCLSNFAFASMSAHYLLSDKKEAGYLQNSGVDGGGWYRFPSFLIDIGSALEICTNAVQSSNFDPTHSLARLSKYTERDRSLMTDLAFESISLWAKLISRDSLDKLKKGEGESTGMLIDKWGFSEQSQLNIDTMTSSKSQEYRSLLLQLAEHSRDERAGVEDDSYLA